MDDTSGSSFHSSTDQYRTDEAKILAIIKLLCQHLDLPDYEVSVSLVTPEEIQQLNRDHRGKDKATDVLSFPQEEFTTLPKLVEHPEKRNTSQPTDAPPRVLGDVIICLDVAQQNAEEIGHGLDRELAFLLVHGVLHLCGYDHEDPKDETYMLNAQRQMMSWLEKHGSTPLWSDCVLARSSSSGEIRC